MLETLTSLKWWTNIFDYALIWLDIVERFQRLKLRFFLLKSEKACNLFDWSIYFRCSKWKNKNGYIDSVKWLEKMIISIQHEIWYDSPTSCKYFFWYILKNKMSLPTWTNLFFIYRLIFNIAHFECFKEQK